MEVKKLESKAKEKKQPKPKLKKGRVFCDTCGKEFPKKMSHKTETKTLCNVCVINEG